MKRILQLFLVLVMVLAFVPCVYATSFSTLQTDFANGGNPTVPKAIIGSGQLYTGPCRILSINYFSTTSGDLVAIYDTIDPALPIATLEFEMGISANNSSAQLNCLQAPFEHGIRVQSTNAASVTTVVFDY